MDGPVYRSDPDGAPDADFDAGLLHHLVVGNRGRLLDARRTPISIAAVMPSMGAFTVEIEAFEDSGARWELPLTEIARLQFRPDSARAPAQLVAELQRAMQRYDRTLQLTADADRGRETGQRIRAERDRFRERLLAVTPAMWGSLRTHIELRTGSPELTALLEACLAELDLVEIDKEFARRFVSNPHSGELIKAHAIVLAELGLCSYRGPVLRDEGVFAERWSRDRRAGHVIARLAFSHELWTRLGHGTVTLYRGGASEQPFEARARSFVSATFSEAVAGAHYAGGSKTHSAVLWRHAVPITRVFMTFLETAAMNDRFHEAEAILIGDEHSAAF